MREKMYQTKSNTERKNMCVSALYDFVWIESDSMLSMKWK